ncbi:unnamed protein product [Paramecium octaurelia]|uniref:Uncharacterized protein n=1 Tax=Paramecium octaurelia TaxID=43137 RepID=A0A8S1YGH9_PAROT|nr:unnamed protein product [Paramecium octaurelia]
MSISALLQDRIAQSKIEYFIGQQLYCQITQIVKNFKEKKLYNNQIIQKTFIQIVKKKICRFLHFKSHQDYCINNLEQEYRLVLDAAITIQKDRNIYWNRFLIKRNVLKTDNKKILRQ